MMQPAVPPVWQYQSPLMLSSNTKVRDQRTSCDDDIDLVDIIWKLSVQTHFEYLEVIAG